MLVDNLITALNPTAPIIPIVQFTGTIAVIIKMVYGRSDGRKRQFSGPPYSFVKRVRDAIGEKKLSCAEFCFGSDAGSASVVVEVENGSEDTAFTLPATELAREAAGKVHVCGAALKFEVTANQSYVIRVMAICKFYVQSKFSFSPDKKSFCLTSARTGDSEVTPTSSGAAQQQGTLWHNILYGNEGALEDIHGREPIFQPVWKSAKESIFLDKVFYGKVSYDGVYSQSFDIWVPCERVMEFYASNDLVKPFPTNSGPGAPHYNFYFVILVHVSLF